MIDLRYGVAVPDEVERLEQMLVGRDEEIRELRAKIPTRINQAAPPV